MSRMMLYAKKRKSYAHVMQRTLHCQLELLRCGLCSAWLRPACDCKAAASPRTAAVSNVSTPIRKTCPTHPKTHAHPQKNYPTFSGSWIILHCRHEFCDAYGKPNTFNAICAATLHFWGEFCCLSAQYYNFLSMERRKCIPSTLIPCFRAVYGTSCTVYTVQQNLVNFDSKAVWLMPVQCHNNTDTHMLLIRQQLHCTILNVTSHGAFGHLMPTCRLVSARGSSPWGSPDSGKAEPIGLCCLVWLTAWVPCCPSLTWQLTSCISKCVRKNATVSATSISAKNLPGHLQTYMVTQ